jgi:hypothetical protein
MIIIRRFNTLFLVFTVIALLAVMIAVVVAASLTSRAVLVQRLEPSNSAISSLFGDGADGANNASGGGTPIGSPQLLIIDDQAAFLPGTAAGGARLVSDTYLREKSIYPLQAKTVVFFRDIVVASALAAALVFGGLWFFGRTKPATLAHTQNH